jgi:hypothetical protein
MKVAKNTENEGVVSLNHNLTKLDDSSFVRYRMDSSPSEKVSQLKSNKESTTNDASNNDASNNDASNNDASNNDASDNGLPFQLKSGIEQLSGISMDDVKVHRNSDKPAQLQAHAYAQGTDIHIASGQEKHLPHEAWHVVQQKQGRVQPTTMMKAKVPINDDQGLEKEADVMGARALQMKPFSLSDYKTEKSVQRKEIIQREIDTSSSPRLPEYAPNETPSWKEVDEATNAKRNQVMKDDFEAERLEKLNAAPKESSTNQRLESVSSEIIDLSTSIKKVKEKKAKEEAAEKAKKDEEARMAEAEAALESAKIAEKEARIAAEEATRIAAVAAEAARIAKETAAAEAARLAAEAAAAEAARIAAENIAIAALDKAETLAEKVGRKLGDYLDGDSTIGNFLDIASVPGKTMDTVAKYMDAGSENRKILEDNVGKGAFVGNMADTCELLSTAGNFFNSEKKPADFALLGLTVGKFVTGVVDSVNTASEGGLIGKALSESITLLPGIKAGLGAFKNGVEGYQTTLKLIGINELLEKTGHLTPENIEVLEKYRTAIKWKLGEIGVDFILNAAESIAMIFPPAQVGIAILHSSINLFKFACKQYISYKDNQELKRSKRIGDADVEKLKSDKIEEKSERIGFIDALKSLSKLENYEKDPVTNEDAIIRERQTLKNAIKLVNDFSLGKEKITEANVATFLTLERLTILSIKKEVADEKGLTERFLNIFKIPQKETIIADLIQQGAINFDNIAEADINNLDPTAFDYFFDKTQKSIKKACDRKHISTNERLDILEKLLLTKHDDAIIKNYMLDKYKDQKIYEGADTDKVKFTKTVKKFKLDMKL